MDTTEPLVSRETFLAAELNDFRFEKGGGLYEFCLFHCKPNGSERFSLNFGCCKKVNDEPYFLTVSLSSVAVSPNPVTVQATINGRIIVHEVPENRINLDFSVTQKVCLILNAHQVSQSIIP